MIDVTIVDELPDALTVEHRKTVRVRIEERTVFIVCIEKEPAKEGDYRSALGRRISLGGQGWTANEEECAAYNTLEEAQSAMRRFAAPWPP